MGKNYTLGSSSVGGSMPAMQCPTGFLNTHMINIGTQERELLLTLSVRAK